MSETPHVQWMIDAGWRKRMLGSEPMFELDLEDRRLLSIPQFAKTATDFILRAHAGVWFEDWARVKVLVFPSYSLATASMVRRGGEPFETPGEGSPAFIAQCTATLTAWAKAVDKAVELENHARFREQYGLFSFDHVTALAMLGRKEHLSAYRSELTAGTSRLHPLVKHDNLERAETVAEAASEGRELAAWARAQGRPAG